LGWTLRAKFPLYVTSDPHIKPYIIPGIGKTSTDVPFDFTIGVYYRFPIFRTKTLPKVIKIGGKTHPGAGDQNDLNNGEYQNSSQSGGRY
jgi:hypothetical protein